MSARAHKQKGFEFEDDLNEILRKTNYKNAILVFHRELLFNEAPRKSLYDDAAPMKGSVQNYEKQFEEQQVYSNTQHDMLIRAFLRHLRDLANSGYVVRQSDWSLDGH